MKTPHTLLLGMFQVKADGSSGIHLPLAAAQLSWFGGSTARCQAAFSHKFLSERDANCYHQEKKGLRLWKLCVYDSLAERW